MKNTNSDTGSELLAGLQLWAEMREKGLASADDQWTRVNPPGRTLQSALVALSEGRVAQAVEQFDDRFTFNDHALALEFRDKPRLTEFLIKSRELFPDTALDVLSTFQDGDHAIARWKLSATQTSPYGSLKCRFGVSFAGSTIVRVENQKIVEWSDYYDQSSSRRVGLAAAFAEWIEY